MKVMKLKGSINNQLVSHTSNNPKNGVPSTTAKWISFCNHRNKKVVGGKHNVLVHYSNASAPDPSGFVLCNPFKWDISLFSSDQKSYIVCVPAVTVKRILCHNHRYRKVVGGTHNVLRHYVDVSAPSSFGIVLCNPSKWF